MKILVLSDSHSSLHFMRRCIETVKPNAVVHLGDYYDDGEAMAEEYPHLIFHRVPGNCDRYRYPPFVRQMLCYDVCGVRLYMTHGHREQVKSGIGILLKEARHLKAKVALYGHTHIADCHQEEDGLWVLNPGSSGYGGGSAGIIETENGQITACRVITYLDLEEML